MNHERWVWQRGIITNHVNGCRSVDTRYAHAFAWMHRNVFAAAHAQVRGGGRAWPPVGPALRCEADVCRVWMLNDRERGGGWTGRTTRRPYVPFTHAPLVLKLSASKKHTPKDCINLSVLDRCIWFSTLETAFETSWDMYVYFFY